MHSIENFPLHNNFEKKAVLISGGTRGIGLAIGLSFAKRGAHVFLTHRWGSADEEKIYTLFSQESAVEPTIIEADASCIEENRSVVQRIYEQGLPIEVFVNCVCVVARGSGLDGLNLRTINRCLTYNVRPFEQILEEIYSCSNQYPKYSLAISSDGHLSYYPGYDYVALSKAVLESMIHFMAQRLKPKGASVNIIRTRNVLTDSYEEIFSEAQRDFVSPFSQFLISPEDVANTALALCSGYLDTINGEVIVLDKGARLMDNIMNISSKTKGITVD